MSRDDLHGPSGPIDWKEHGVKVIPGNSLDPNTPQTPGMNRAVAIDFARLHLMEKVEGGFLG